MGLFKCITRLVTENLLEVNLLLRPKYSWNLKKSTFFQVFHHSDPNWVSKSYFQSDLRFLDCLLTRWLPTTSYLVAIETIYGCQFKSNYLKNENLFADFSLSSWYLHEISNVLKKNEPHKWIFSGVIDSERWAYLNA